MTKTEGMFQTLLRRKEIITSSGGDGRNLPGYTVSTIPTDWNLGKDANSRVIEVADTFIGKQTHETQKGMILFVWRPNKKLSF